MDSTVDICAEQLRLRDLCEAAEAEYNRTMGFLNRKIGVLPVEDYESVRQAGERAKARCETARDALAHHRTTHGC